VPIGATMRIHYDWRLARVVDYEGNIVDELEWDGPITLGGLSKRLMTMQRGRNLPEVSTLSERFPDALIDEMGALSDPNWPEIGDLQGIFHEATLELAKIGVADSSGDLDRRLDMLVSAAHELRSSWTTSEARCVEWAGLFITEANLDSQRNEIPVAISSSRTISEASERLGVNSPKHLPSDSEWSSMVSHANVVTRSSDILDQIENSIREIANNHVPSLSALLGPLSAAKLISLAGGRERLARMPSGSLQVLGAHAAMSAHRKGAPPPKHGAVLFSMPQVSRSPRWVRGKIARYLAGKASIAVRVDHFEGERWDESKIEEINSEIEVIKDKFPRPPKRRE
jgi:nucleolar protein 56